MPSNTRTVYFYRLILEKNKEYNTYGESQTILVSNTETFELFKDIYNSMQKLNNGNRAKIVAQSKSQAVVEVLSIENCMAFIRIGKPNTANTVGIRDKETLEINSLQMSQNQNLELFTYCLIDFDTCIVSYIGLQGAPKINALVALFESLDCTLNISARLTTILTDDIIQLISKKNIIGKISFTISNPSDDVLANINIGAKEFDALRNVKYREVTYEVTASRNKNIFGRSSDISNLFNSLVGRFGDKLRKFKVRAKDPEESMQTYNLIDYNFTRKVMLRTTAEFETLKELDFYNALKTTYTQNKDDLLRYIRVK